MHACLYKFEGFEKEHLELSDLNFEILVSALKTPDQAFQERILRILIWYFKETDTQHLYDNWQLHPLKLALDELVSAKSLTQPSKILYSLLVKLG